MEKQAWHAPSLNIFDMVLPTGDKVELQRGQAIVPNADTPLEFENEFFKGKVLFLLQTQPAPPKWQQLFLGRRRLFWIQLQGQFKQEPRGLVYIGGEVSNKLRLGLLATTMCRVILSVLNLLVAGLHYGFGRMYPTDVRQRGEEELAHISFPLHSSVDEFVRTPAGQTPPPLGQDGFGETQADRSARKAAKGRYQFNTRDTYTFSFFSFYIDFEHWQLVNVPGVPVVPLEKFWQTMPMRIVAYSIASATDMSTKKPHTHNEKQYYMNMELSPTRFRDI
ncbi:hypothetical protein SPRG_02428 [Saprolegnia parasitica CBS 223.65]|uniref:Domain of unknown function at the cortex 1 domain-containing protein n=1 Tax=Saprolegnia parasitica (strain CBS 223.65) TaxID=695850 RepID=A0A067CU18_SAPPC|nr:hypothetical protein SPRG_02428 [Saprolegnia parasitica CBS 223.65]KDO32730.1 hypothetical protein SPRG_02428 [Saprolegnia parasitica CBS 223.65]|eukprot:XP_012196394.1 hypothetical protein SPRG_02428 [Saprolegnia parasitica CBS 223.65]